MHQFKPDSKEAALLDDPEMLAAVTGINRQIRELAPVINSRAPNPSVEIERGGDAVWSMAKRYDGATWLFAVNHRNEAVKAGFKISGATANGTIEVLGESRTVQMEGQGLIDNFAPYAVHLYAIREKK